MERLLYLEPEQYFNSCLLPSCAFCQLLPYSGEQPGISEVFKVTLEVRRDDKNCALCYHNEKNPLCSKDTVKRKPFFFFF